MGSKDQEGIPIPLHSFGSSIVQNKYILKEYECGERFFFGVEMVKEGLRKLDFGLQVAQREIPKYNSRILEWYLKTLNSKLWLSHMTLPLYLKTSLKSYLKMTAWTLVFILFYFYFCSFFYSLFLLFSSSLTNINNILVPDVSQATESKSLSVSQKLFTSTRPFLGGENVSHFAIS